MGFIALIIGVIFILIGAVFIVSALVILERVEEVEGKENEL